MTKNTGTADLILTEGKVLTVDPAFHVAQAVAVRGDRILAVGGNEEIRALADERTERIDLRGRTLMPGLIDCHAHMDREGLKEVYPSLGGARSIDDVLQLIEAQVRKASPGEWIVTMPLGDPPYYWDVPNNLREKRFPTRWELDRVSPQNPVYIRSIWGYWRHTLPLASVANSTALRLAGIDSATVSPCAAVKIEKDAATGEPTGVFLENALVPIVEHSLMAAAPHFTRDHRARGLRRSMHIYNTTGTTSVYEGHGIAAEVLEAYKTLRDTGASTVRAHLIFSPSWEAVKSVPAKELLESWGRWLARPGLGDSFVRVAGLYAEVDDSLENKIRAGQRPYTGWAGFNYDAGLPRERLKEVLVEAARNDIRVCGIVPDLLELYREVDKVQPIAGKRWVLGHFSVLTPDQIRLIRDLGLVLTSHTNRYLLKEGDILRRRCGPEGENNIVPLRSLVDAGVHVALASDNVPTSLFHPVWHCVARVCRYSGEVVAPAQRLTREEALRAATREGAYVTFEENEKGSIEPGKLADFAVLSADPLSVETDQLKDIVADMTFVGGRVVFDRSAPASTAETQRTQSP